MLPRQDTYLSTTLMPRRCKARSRASQLHSAWLFHSTITLSGTLKPPPLLICTWPVTKPVAHLCRLSAPLF